MKTFRLLFWSAVAYAVLLVLVDGLFPSEATSSLPVTGIPLIVITVIIARDLTKRSTEPSVRKMSIERPTMKGNPVQFFSGQIKVATNASESYFEDVIRSRLKELLVTKVSVETGLDPENVRQLLAKPRTGLQLLNDEALYAILYGPIPETSIRRIGLVSDAIDLIGAWKG